jgi:hypothetical protein
MFSVDTYIAGLPVTTLNGAYNVCSAGADPGICNGGGGSRKKNKLMTFFLQSLRQFTAFTPRSHILYHYPPSSGSIQANISATFFYY